MFKLQKPIGLRMTRQRILTDTVQMLKDLTAEVNRLMAECASLSEEPCEVILSFMFKPKGCGLLILCGVNRCFSFLLQTGSAGGERAHRRKGFFKI